MSERNLALSSHIHVKPSGIVTRSSHILVHVKPSGIVTRNQTIWDCHQKAFILLAEWADCCKSETSRCSTASMEAAFGRWSYDKICLAILCMSLSPTLAEACWRASFVSANRFGAVVFGPMEHTTMSVSFLFRATS